MKQLVLVLSLLLVLSVFTTAFAHPGGTDSQGGHYDHSTGEYHFHHGMGPHDHPNGVCPYSSTPKATAKPDKSYSYSYDYDYSYRASAYDDDLLKALEKRIAEDAAKATPEPTPIPERRSSSEGLKLWQYPLLLLVLMFFFMPNVLWAIIDGIFSSLWKALTSNDDE